MTRNRTIVLAGLTVGLGVALFLVLRPTAAPPPAPPPAPVAQPASPTRGTLSLDKLFAEGRAKAGEVPAPGDPAASSWGIEDAVGELLEAEPEMKKFYNLRRKALRTSAEQHDYLAMISDAKLIDDAREGLLAATSGKEVDQVEEVKRLQHIQFLNSALAWAENPERARALGAVSDVVNQEVPSGTPKAVIGSALGDKFDLFQLLVLTDPDQAKALLARAQGTPREKILQLAWQTGVADLPSPAGGSRPAASPNGGAAPTTQTQQP